MNQPHPTGLRRVLVIEDDDDQGSIICRMLRREGLDPWIAKSFAEGLACAHAHDFSVIILDLGLPDTASSMETLRRMEEFGGGVPLVVLTGDDDPALIRECSVRGAGYELKPLNLMTFIPKVLLRIERNHPSTELEERIVEHAKEASETTIKESTIVSLSIKEIAGIVVAIVGITTVVLAQVNKVNASVEKLSAQLTETSTAVNKQLVELDTRMRAQEARELLLSRWRINAARDIRELGDATKREVITNPATTP